MAQDNIILITTDQQRFDTIQALGNQQIFTPNLNYMMRTGIAYTRCYADCPICVPSRTTIMTGLKGYESSVVTNATHEAVMTQAAQARTTLPALLTDAGYQTCAMGKMHFTPARACYGFEKMRLPLDYMREYDRKADTARPKIHGASECEIEPAVSTVDVKDSITTWITDGAIDFLETKDPQRPFFMWTSYTKPHPPFDPCRDFWDLYRDIQVDAPIYGDWSQDLNKVPQGFMRGCYTNTNMHLFSQQQAKVTKKAYYAMISQVDYSLGRLFACLRENHLFENTWVIFTADHGEMLGDHHMSQKSLFFEGAAHVPLIVMPPQKYKDLPRNVQVSTLAQMADLYPTILAMAGIQAPVGTGLNLLDLPEQDRIFYGDSSDDQFCVMENSVKLVYSAVGDHTLLFDLKKDPMEQRDLSRDPAYAQIRSHLYELMLENVRKYRPELMENGKIRTIAPPRFPGDVNSVWFGYHAKDYSVDTFH